MFQTCPPSLLRISVCVSRSLVWRCFQCIAYCHICVYICRWIQWSSSIAYQQLSVHCSACDKQRFHSFIHPVILSSSLRFPAIPKRLSAASFTDVRWQSFYSSHPAVSHNGVKCIDVGIHLKCRNSVPHTVPVLRLLHTTSGDQGERDSKVDKTLVALKDSAKKVTPEKKKTLWARFKAEMVHYYHGFRLLFIDIRVAVRLVWQVLRGRSLVRRERQQVSSRQTELELLANVSVWIQWLLTVLGWLLGS